MSSDAFDIPDFYNDSAIQDEYVNRVRVLAAAVKRTYGQTFNLGVHLKAVMELARSEIAAEKYERKMANGKYGKNTEKNLRAERLQRDRLREQLGLTIVTVERLTGNKNHETPTDFMDHAEQMLNDAIESGELNLDELREDLEKKDPEPEDINALKENLKMEDVDTALSQVENNEEETTEPKPDPNKFEEEYNQQEQKEQNDDLWSKWQNQDKNKKKGDE